MSTPQKAIRAICKQCVGTAHQIEDCGGKRIIIGSSEKTCQFYRYRTGKGNGRPSVKLIRSYCIDCMGGRLSYVRECMSMTCPLHPYRMGSNPMRKGIGGARKAQQGDSGRLTVLHI